MRLTWETIMGYSTVGCIVTLILGLLLPPHVADAQPPGKVPRIGFLGVARPLRVRHRPWNPCAMACELGHVEGQNIILETRWTDGQSARLPELAEEFIRLQVAVIVTHGVPGALAARTATTTMDSRYQMDNL